MQVNLACDMFPGSVLGPIVIGVLSICGGKISVDTIRLAQVAHGPLVWAPWTVGHRHGPWSMGAWAWASVHKGMGMGLGA